MEFLQATGLSPDVLLGALCVVILIAWFVLRRLRAASEERLRIHRQKQRERLIAFGKNEALSADQKRDVEVLVAQFQADEEGLTTDKPLLTAIIQGKLLLGDAVKAEKWLKTAIQRFPADTTLWQDLGIDLLVVKRSGDQQSIERLQEACIRRPARASWGKRLLALMIAGAPLSRQAAQALWGYYQAHRDSRALQLLGESYEKKKLFTRESLPVFTALTETEKGKVRWQYALARCLYESGDHAGAGEALQQALSLDSSYQPAIEFSRRLREQATPSAATRRLASPPPAGDGAVPVSDAESEIPLPARYAQVVEIGRGGMGTVYRAFDEVLARQVAIKTFNERLASSDPELRERFLSESRILAALDHPSIPKVFDVSVTPPVFIAFEFIKGENLRTLLEAGPLPLATTLQMGIEIAEGLQHAFERGILHRDIKPENILIEMSGRSRIVDFGLAHGAGKAQLTQTGVIVGTPWYLAPERLRGQPATLASEIFAFGVTLFEMICGRRPFSGDDVTVILVQDPPRPAQLRAECPSRLEVLVLDCISKNPNNRPPDFREIRNELTALARETTR